MHYQIYKIKHGFSHDASQKVNRLRACNVVLTNSNYFHVPSMHIHPISNHLQLRFGTFMSNYKSE